MTSDAPQPLKLLISYHYWKRVDLAEMDGDVQLFGDSGAFSAHTVGAQIDLDVYMDWLHRWKHRLHVYAGLDDLTSVKRSVENYRIMRENGLDPLPTYHYGEPWSVLDEYMSHTKYIALGGMVGESYANLMRWVIQCFKRARDKGEGHVYHGFGLTKMDALKALPWYSVDSSSWGSGHRYGRAYLWDEMAGKMRTAGRSELATIPALRGTGIRDALELGGWRVSMPVIMHNIEQWRKLESWLRRRHGLVPCESRPDGLHLYLVDGSTTVGREVVKAWKRKEHA